MKKQSFISKLFISLAFSSGAVWFGSYLSKLFTVYNLFEPKDLTLKASFELESINYVLAQLLPVFVTPFIAYIIMIVSGFSALLFAKINLKKNGWLFISVMLVLITLPFEIYLMLIDYKVINLLISSTYHSEFVLELLRNRITSLSGFPIIELLCYLSITFLIVFKPLASKVILKNED